MLPKEVRPGRRNAPEMDRRLPWSVVPRGVVEAAASSSSKLSRSEMKGSRAKRPQADAGRTSVPASVLEEDPTTRRSAIFPARSRRDLDAAESQTHGEIHAGWLVTRNHPASNATNNNLTCNCRNVVECCNGNSGAGRVAATAAAAAAASCKNSCSSSCDRSTRSKPDQRANVRWSRCSTRNIFLGRRAWPLFSLVLVAMISFCSGNLNQCALGITTPGRTWPQGDIILEYGQPLSILCMLNKTFIDTAFPGKNASDLLFIRNKKEIEPEYIRIINETTIEMYVERPPPAEDMYYCKLRLNGGYNKQHEAVCLNKVVIGFKPQEPQNFSCVSYNWESLICSWDPVHNYVTTKFTLVFKLPGRAGGRKLYPCPKEEEPVQPNTCRWDASTSPIYRQPYESYTFIMSVANALGNISVQYKFHHYAHVIPAKPANLSVVNKTSESALLHWSVPFPMQNFPSGLHHRLAYQNQWDSPKTWQVINITNDIHTPKRYYNFTGLAYANTVYDVRVFMKSAVAIGEDKWSNFSDVTFRTLPKLPGGPPRTDVGSFEIAENTANRDVYLYWQAIAPHHENGDNFKYQVTHVEEDGRERHLLPNETTRTYAKFKGISFNSFRFEVATTNLLGANKNKARIFVPSRSEMPKEPQAFTKIAFDGGLYELSWKPPVNSQNVTNYTIFWCDNERDRPYQCNGYLDWVHVPANTTIYNMTTDPSKVYQFAISANTAAASSGMVWASCTVIHNKVVGKMKSVWINRIGSNFIEVGWKLDCSDRIGIVEGFNIYYCPIVSPYDRECKKGSKLRTTIPADPHTIHGSVYGLKPYTTYSITVAVLTKSGEGLPSDPLLNTTLEAPPSTPPLDVQVTNVTNTTMFVSWNSPTAMNGVLRYYEVHYNGKSQKVEEANGKIPPYVLLRDLASHRNYSISVAACTVSCSVRSTAILRTTDIGLPGKITKIPIVRFMNSSQLSVKWTPPNNPGGFLDYYQIWMTDGDIRNSSKTEAYLPIPDCDTVGRLGTYQFRVRAINVASDGAHLAGPWSETGEGGCYSHGPSPLVMVIIWIISCLGVLVFLFCIAYTSKRMWLKCKAMQDVEVKLPPGLAPNMKLLQKVGEQHIRQSSADSSGCSSGQESVTSSLTSDSHVSTDSGADVDPVHPPANNKLLEAPPAWEASRLRQRNVGTTRPPGGTTSGETPRWDSYVKVAKTGEPIIDDAVSLARSTPNLTDSIGYTASPQAWSSTGYISMPSSEELSSNPSPVPKESNPGGYSVVGVAPKPLRLKSDQSQPQPQPQPQPQQDQPRTTTIPYVSLAALEQKSKDAKTIDSLDFSELSFRESPSSELAFKPALDAASKPYVQTGLLETMNKPFAPTGISGDVGGGDAKSTYGASLADSRKPFASTFTSPMNFKRKMQQTDSAASKPYVAVGWTPESTGKSAFRSEPVKSAPKSVPAEKPYVTAAAAFQTLQQRVKPQVAQTQPPPPPPPPLPPPTLGDEERDNKSLPSPYSMYWETEGLPEVPGASEVAEKTSAKRAPSYVTVGENPRLETTADSAAATSATAATTASSPYVQHQRFEKSAPNAPTTATATTTTPHPPTTTTTTTTTTTDEQYSKVSVAPPPNVPQ